MEEKMKKYLALALLTVVGLTLAGEFVFPSNNTAWNVYYERQARAAYFNSGIPENDSLSYLGRLSTFVPGYLTMKAGFLKMTGLEFNIESDLIFKIITNVSIALSAFYLSSRAKLEPRVTMVFFLGVLTQNFMLLWIFGYSAHMLGLSLFFFALGYSMGKHRTIVLAAIVAISGLMHSSYLIAYPFLAFVMNDKARLKETARTAALAGLIFLVFYSPVLLRAGLPYEIKATEWGYGITGSAGAFIGYLLLWTAPVLLALYKAIQNQAHARMRNLILILTAVFLFGTYRVNVFMGILLVFLTAVIFRNDILRSRKFYYLLIALGLLNVASIFYFNYGISSHGQNGAFNEWTERPLFFLGGVPGDRVVSDPYYGHAIAYYTNKKVLADLYVEYANEQKYDDAMSFVKGDLRVISKYNITGALFDNKTNSNGVPVVFTNGYFSVGAPVFQKKHVT
ncbi:MAG: hypothetical protein QXO69_01215 [archaeon]